MREIEIKLRALNLQLVEQKLLELGCELSDSVTQEDINFIHKDDTKWFEVTDGNFLYPRIRKQNDKPLKLTVKKPLLNEMDCIEHELEINDTDEARAIMEMFGYVEGVTVKKTRKTAKFEDYTITLDEVEELGSFVEIERVVTDGDAQAIQQSMFDFAKTNFGLEKDEKVMKGYDILMHYKLQEKADS